ncbi:hypothetical protein [Actimicrobium sp. CCI2.3]|uniref:hypothetical protein n=1 Tax=Actimicrobium sp. CCI2.3 TaxID=3048616 RepID=UPI002AB4A46D|nr:hypothetical protein [Actimicrobium sp. CCI2.3]MDY7573937.1 hypothetical protein [Actimicrobium sp. CCI2.3]MEB0023069.1 hypothetical protein [Actimicrobium sp. CCI2.3]
MTGILPLASRQADKQPTRNRRTTVTPLVGRALPPCQLTDSGNSGDVPVLMTSAAGRRSTQAGEGEQTSTKPDEPHYLQRCHLSAQHRSDEGHPTRIDRDQQEFDEQAIVPPYCAEQRWQRRYRASPAIAPFTETAHPAFFDVHDTEPAVRRIGMAATSAFSYSVFIATTLWKDAK